MTDAFLMALLRKKGLRDTQSRRLVLAELERSRAALSPYDLQKKIAARGDGIHTVTVYRVLALLEKLHLVHRHPCNGLYTLCRMPAKAGHHGFLHCTSCGGIEEFNAAALCTIEDRIARGARFRPHHHVSELVGECRTCRHS